MEKLEIINSIELFFKADLEIQKQFEFAISNRSRETELEKCNEKIARYEGYKNQPDEEILLKDTEYKYLSPKRVSERVKRITARQKEDRLDTERKLEEYKTLKTKVAAKEMAVSEFNRLVLEVSNSTLMLWLEQECNLSLMVTKILKKKILFFVPNDYMSEPFEINDRYHSVLLARIISKPLLNYLNVPENLPDKTTFRRAGKLAEELLELVERHKELIPSAIRGSGPHIFKTVLSQIAIDHLSQSEKTKMGLTYRDSAPFTETAMMLVQPRESLKEIRYEEQRRLKIQLLFEDMGIRYIDTFALHNTKKGRPHAELLLDLIPRSCLELDDMPDTRTLQRWLSNLDGYGTTRSTQSPKGHRPFSRDGKAATHVPGSVIYIGRWIDKPNLKD